MFVAKCRQVPQRFETGQEEVSSASYGGESRQSLYRFTDWSLRDLELQRPILRANERITLIAKFVKIPIIDPHVLRKLELAKQAGTSNESSDPPFNAILGLAFGQRRAVGAAAANHLPPIYVRGCVAGIHPPDMSSEWDGIAVRIHFFVVEVVVSLHVRP